MDQEVETAKWYPSNPALFIATCDEGLVRCFDCRKSSQPLFSFEAHKKGVSGISFNRAYNKLFATSSLDATVCFL